MNDFEHDKELQIALLKHHPALKHQGIDPLWRWIAIIGWITAFGLMVIAARGEEVTGERLKVEGNLQPATRNLQPATCNPQPKTLITERFLDALEEVESGRDARAVGDHGRSLGSYQFKAVAWAQVNTLRAARGLGTRSYLFYATHRVTARLYAREYLGWLESHMTRALHRSPTRPELYAVWNLGPAGFRARGFDLRKCPAHVRRAGERLN